MPALTRRQRRSYDCSTSRDGLPLATFGMNTPLYFGPAAQPLFGMLHRPVGAMRRTGILICPSWGIEYQRAYRGLRQLAQTLNHNGFAALRFDYSGTGDSGGDSRLVSLEAWLEDTRYAARELRATTGTEYLCVLGLRFGALLAQQAVATGTVLADAIALWDAPPTGAVYVSNLHYLQEELREKMRLQRQRRGASLVQAPDELLCYDWPPALARPTAELAGLREDIANRHIFVSRDRPPPERAQSLRLPDPSHWGDVERLNSPWLPSASFGVVARQLASVLP